MAARTPVEPRRHRPPPAGRRRRSPLSPNVPEGRRPSGGGLLDTATGETRARRSGTVETPPTLAAGRLQYVESEYADDTETAAATAFGPSLDHVCWRTDLDTGSPVRVRAPGVSPRLVFYPISVGDEHAVLALDAASGRPEWRTVLPGAPEPFPTVRTDRVFLGANTGENRGTVVALDRRTGAVEWRRELDADAFVGAVTNSTVLVREGTDLDREPDALVARDAATGRVRWQVTTDERTEFTLPTSAGDAAFVCRTPSHTSVDAPGTLERYDLATGERTATVPTADEWVSAPVVGDGYVAISTDRGLQVFG
ncbi:PQQ-binding-like beta-propeller repeat protein [Halospeciosus flavus]|uniref:PQQ-binding-like beta-propeller repeat protein n=1 Tax=Halospeciosus flavus TaxID=3032283 RepID=A0ABD5YX90_9EURY|nr:PQQ-binding-like beta-propeller repeat protein [Halospeciosus flavus]